MIIKEEVSFKELTTLRVGGPARYVCMCASEDDVREALAFAQKQGLPWHVLGGGSNVLAKDEGFARVLIYMQIQGILYEDAGDCARVSAGAGVPWEELVTETAGRGLWGVENLAGIPGTVGAAPVQNIGAYGSEVKDTILSVRVLDTKTGVVRDLSPAECEFRYRDSIFKRSPELIILSVSFLLAKKGLANVSYKDLSLREAAGEDLSSPASIGTVVRSIRAKKFPDIRTCGTAGSFFKNPTIPNEAFEEIRAKYPELPGFPNEHGVKIPLAFVLDKILSLRGHRAGNVSLFTEQPLVLVADKNATASEIDAFANDIAERVAHATNIHVEREVQTFA